MNTKDFIKFLLILAVASFIVGFLLAASAA